MDQLDAPEGMLWMWMPDTEEMALVEREPAGAR